MKLKKTLALMSACAMLASGSLGAVAVEKTANANDYAITSETSDVQPRVRWTGNAYISKAYWCNVTSSNNIFKDSPSVTNHAGNPGTIKVRIINSSGSQVGSTKTIGTGKTVTMSQIPAFSGTYTLQAIATEKNGTYTITIN